MTEIHDRLPREALIALPPETLADTLLAAWRDVDAQQRLLDEIGQETGRSGLSFTIQHAPGGNVAALCCGPYEQINEMGPRLRKVFRQYLRLLGIVKRARAEGLLRETPAEPAAPKEDSDV